MPEKKIVPDELRCSLTRELTRERERTKLDMLHKKYSPGNKGGGWKVVPQITRQDLVKYYHFQKGEMVTISSPAPINNQHSSV